MKKQLLTLLAIGASLIAFAQSPAPSLTISGSEAMYPAVNKLGTEFKRTYPQQGLTVTVSPGGSTVGILNLLEGHSNVAVSSRKMTKQEEAEFKAAKVTFKEFLVSREAITIVVHKNNPIYKLTPEQVAGIFSGRIKNWKEVGGEDEPIRVFIRGNSSGCYQGFKDMVFKDTADYSASALQLGSNAQIKQNLNKYQGGISFLGFNASSDPNLKVIKIAFDGEHGVAPTQLTIDDGSYKLVRNCYVYTTDKVYNSNPAVKSFIEYITSPKASDIWDDNGFDPIVTK